jgi:autotransporter-associated beta strand protein
MSTQHIAVKMLSCVAFASVVTLSSAHAADGIWVVDTNGLWSAVENWSGGTSADGSTSTATFTNNITADRIVSLDSARTLNKLVFSDSVTATPGSWLIDNNGNAANILTLGGTTPTITVNALGTGKTAEISAIISGSTASTKLGGGTLVLSGANNFTSSLSMGAASGTTQTGGIIIMNNPSASIGGAAGATNDISIRNGAFRQSTGKVTVTGSNTSINSPASGAFVVGGDTRYGAYELSGGILEINDPWRMNPRRSQITQTGGAMSISYTGSGAIQSGREFFIGSASERAVVYATAGTTTVTTASTLTGAALVISDTANSGTSYNLNGSELTLAGTADWTVSGGAGFIHMTRGGDGERETGNLNLNSAGRLTTRGIAQGDTDTGAIGRLNFNGGTLRAGSDNATFLQGLTTTRIYSGGATIDTDGKNITIGQDLLAPTGNGLASVALTTGGSGYFGAPIVTIKDGGGTGATAVANFDATTRTVTGITITSPGSGYTSAPTVEINHGRDGGGNPTLGTITLSALTSGGLTKIGTGTLTLSGQNTYSGATTVNEGALFVNGSLASAVNVASGATLGGTNTIGSATLASGAILEPGAATNLIGTLTLSGTAPALSGRQLVADLSTTSGVCDKLVLSGTVDLAGLTVTVKTAGTLSSSNTYVLLSSTSLSGRPTLAGDLSYPWQLTVKNNTLVLSKAFGTMVRFF